MKQALKAFAKNTVFANIVLLLIFLGGWLAVRGMIKETYPEFSLDMITVSIAYPGADPEEIEEGICRKIEEALEGLDGVGQYTTTASENAGSALIEVRENYPVEEVLDRVRTRIDAVTTFPADAERPVVTEFIYKEPVLTLYVAGRMSDLRLKQWADDLTDDLRTLPSVSQIELFDRKDYEISIEVSEERLKQYNLSVSQVSEAIRQSSLNLSGGTIRTGREDIRVRTVGRKYTGRELGSIVVLAKPEGGMITLDRIADIKDGFSEDPMEATINGDPAMMIQVGKTREEDALAISQEVRDFVARHRQRLPEGAHFDILYDNTDILRARIDLLTRNGIMGIIIVFALLWAFLDVRLSFWAGMGIPVSVAGGLLVLWAMGGTINMISLFGLIMVLGIVVDDAIVVGEAIYVHRKNGKPALDAAVDGLSEVGFPVAAAVATTVTAFVPLLYVGGILGKFIAILPVVVIACLVVSLVECLILLPAHLGHLPGPEESRLKKRFPANVSEWTNRSLEWFVDRIYKPFLAKTLRYRYLSLCAALSLLLLTMGVVRGGFIKFRVFPEIDGFVITSTVKFPDGTPAAITRNATTKIEAALLRMAEKTPTRSGAPLIVDRLALVGRTLSDIPDEGPHVGAVQAVLTDSKQRGIHAKDLLVAWEKEVGPIAGASALTFEGFSAGPPGDPIEIWIQGHNQEDILAAGERLIKRLKEYDGVYQVRSDHAVGKKEVRLSLKPEARNLGVSLEDLASQVYAGYFGHEALRVQRGKDDIKVKVRYTAEERSRLSDLENMIIRTRNGREIPLMSVADITSSPGYSTITRTNGMRRITVSAGVDIKKNNPSEILRDLSAHLIPETGQIWPKLHIAVQGEQKKARESLGSLTISFPLSVIGIFVIIASMFRSYLQPLIILFAIPFGFIGAVAGHLLMGYDLSIMSVFGMVALAGVVVNDAIVLIERVNENLAGGLPFFESIVEAGARRFRAIFLTSISTVGGLLPLILETDLQAKFLIPMALSMAAGLMFATVITLILIPGLLVILNDLRLLAHAFIHGERPARETVEPAGHRAAEPVSHGRDRLRIQGGLWPNPAGPRSVSSGPETPSGLQAYQKAAE
ncbi:efflux RND transporter permease subunit [Desulfatiferula olefinivorans]